MLTEELLKECFDGSTIENLFECYDLEGYVDSGADGRSRLLTLYGKLCETRNLPESRAQFSTVLDVALMIYKRGKDGKDAAAALAEFNHNCWRSAFFTCNRHHSLGVLRKQLSYYFAFRRNTCPGERDIRVIKESHGNASRQAVRDTIIAQRYMPVKGLTDIATKYYGESTNQWELEPTELCRSWQEDYLSYFGRHHGTRLKVRSDKGRAHRRADSSAATRQGLRRAACAAIDKACTKATSGDSTLFGGRTRVSQLARRYGDVKTSLAGKFAEIQAKYAAYRQKRRAEDKVKKGERYMKAIGLADLDGSGQLEARKAGKKVERGKLMKAYCKARVRFDPRGDGNTVFVSPEVKFCQVPERLPAPFGKVAFMQTAALVIVPSLHVASNLKTKDRREDLDQIVLNCILFGRRLATPDYLRALEADVPPGAEFPSSVKFESLATRVAVRLHCAADYRATSPNTYRMLFKACTLHGSKWRVVEDAHAFEEMQKDCASAPNIFTCLKVGCRADLDEFVRLRSSVDRMRSSSGRFVPLEQ